MAARKRVARVRAPIDQDAAHELDLYIENESSLYPQKRAILANIKKKRAKGIFDKKKAAKLWLYWVDSGARKYEKEFGSGGGKIFNKPTREKVAEDLAEHYQSGNE